MAGVALTRKVTLRPSGRLGREPFYALVGTLGALGATGILELRRRKLVRRVVFIDGAIAAHISNARDERLLEWAVSAGKLELGPDPLAALSEALGDASLSARALVEHGCLDEAGVRALGTEHLRAMLADVATWKEGEYSITPGRVDLGDEPPLSCPALATAVALSRGELPAGAPGSITPLTVVARFDADGAAKEAPGLGELERTVLAACTRPMRRDELAATIDGADPAAIEAAVSLVWRSGLVEASTVTAAAAAVAAESGIEVSRDEIEMFLAAADAGDLEALIGVKAGSEEAAIQRAYYATVRRFHPDRFRQGPFSTYHGAIEKAFHLVHEALAALVDPTYASKVLRREESGEAELERLVRGYLASARDLVARGQRVDAVTMLDQALQRAPDDAGLRLARASLLAFNPSRRDEALRDLNALSSEFPGHSNYLATVGLALRAAGREIEGNLLIEHAESLDANAQVVRAARGDRAAIGHVSADPIMKHLLEE